MGSVKIRSRGLLFYFWVHFQASVDRTVQCERGERVTHGFKDGTLLQNFKMYLGAS